MSCLNLTADSEKYTKIKKHQPFPVKQEMIW